MQTGQVGYTDGGGSGIHWPHSNSLEEDALDDGDCIDGAGVTKLKIVVAKSAVFVRVLVRGEPARVVVAFEG